MTDNDKITEKQDAVAPAPEVETEEMALDDARRLKVLSPGMLVFKRFIRNRLAVIGLGILVVMFIFAFLGPFFSPYKQTQVFKGIGSMSKEYASATYNTELRYNVADGEAFGPGDRAQFLLAIGKNQSTFTSGANTFSISKESESTYRLLRLEPVAEELLGRVNPVNGATLSDALIEMYKKAKDNNQTSFVVDGVTYYLVPKLKATQISTAKDIALASLVVFDAYKPADTANVNSFAFKLGSIMAIIQDKKTFDVNGQVYKLVEEGGLSTIYNSAGEAYAEVSDIIVNPVDQANFLPVDFKRVIRETINNRQDRLTPSITSSGIPPSSSSACTKGRPWSIPWVLIITAWI